MPSDELGPMPEPEIEPGEPNPGGVDALDDFSGPIAIPDLTPDENPAIVEKAPETVMREVEDSEDTSTKATRDEDDAEHHEDESPA
ncbi:MULTISPECIES: hypothetical protein [unclassified Nocardioides]|uniref:hypothetical protein n=1 Tax=unclassified Nocardioides TaxID=2615069 RepID=UPI0009F12C08|nr:MULTISPECIES: hypothetical protein [unclassified Nocardioides]GAW49036.1 uncharacterized protein PD653B2_1356 [Nocardioides sp. PD653-B2]GAW53192.1 uncharacterized protein PD653_0590 [Nocardioides sp. PD653]